MKKRIVIGIAAFLIPVLIFGAVLGILAARGRASAVVGYDGTALDREEVCFFLSREKAQYLKNVREAEGYAQDTPAFWASPAGEGETHGERFLAMAKEDLSRLVASVYLYAGVTRLSAEEREKIDRAVEERIAALAEDGADFEEQIAPFGFDADAFASAARMTYQVQTLPDAIYGKEGAALMTQPTLCGEAVTGAYAHVYTVFVRTAWTFVLSGGERVPDPEGDGDATRPLTASEKAERERRIAEIRAALYAMETGGDGQMTPAAFLSFADRYDELDRDHTAFGYYFLNGASYTDGFPYPAIPAAAQDMTPGEYREVDVGDGVCFLFRAEGETDAYRKGENEDFFSDFYACAARYLCDESVERIAPLVVFSDAYGEIDALKIPYNSIYYIKGF